MRDLQVAHALLDPVCDAECAVEVDCRHDAGEFFAAVARHQVAGPPQAGLDRAGHQAQRVVAQLVAIAVVVALEVINVEHQQADRGRTAHRAPPLEDELLVEAAPVVHTRQAVDENHLPQQVGLVLEHQVGFDARAHGRRIHRLGDEVDRAHFETARFLRRVVVRGDEDDRNVARVVLALEPAADFVAVHVGHHHVQQHQVGRVVATQRQRLGTAGRHLHPVVG